MPAGSSPTAVPSTLSCQACGAPLRPDDSPSDGVEHGALRCTFCGAWTAMPGSPRRVAPVRPLVEQPRAIALEDTPYGLRLVRRWFSPLYFVLLFFCVFWNGILLFMYGVMTSAGAPLFALLFPVLHVAVGVGLAYTTLAGFVNRTIVEIDRDAMLTVRHTPLPWPGAASIETSDVAQVFVSEKVSTSKNGSTSRTYTVNALTKTGKRVTLVRGLLHDVDHALFIEQELERRLRIADRPVAGEVARG